MTEAVMSLTSSDGYVPMDADDIAIVLSVPEEESGLLEQALDTLISSGILARTKRGKIAAAAETGEAREAGKPSGRRPAASGLSLRIRSAERARLTSMSRAKTRSER